MYLNGTFFVRPPAENWPKYSGTIRDKKGPGWFLLLLAAAALASLEASSPSSPTVKHQVLTVDS